MSSFRQVATRSLLLSTALLGSQALLCAHADTPAPAPVQTPQPTNVAARPAPKVVAAAVVHKKPQKQYPGVTPHYAQPPTP
jgi:hypothetical protein